MRTISISACFCLLVALSLAAEPAAGNWVDKSPHREGFIKSNGISLEYLDWGGQGDAILFLAGLGNTAHIFDDLAPEFTNHFQVFALTRRGFGKSDKPAAGYDPGILVDDIGRFLDARDIRRVILVGHSFAGMEMTQFAITHPERVNKLVYLDCAYSFDQPGTAEVFSRMDSLSPGPSSQDRAQFSTLREWFRNNRPGWNDACEADLRSTRLVVAGKYSGHSSTPDAVEETLEKEVFAAHNDYSRLTMPVLAFFADHRLDKLVDQSLATSHPEAEQTRSLARSWLHNQIELFSRQAKNGQVVELKDTDHFCFIQRPDQVVQRIQSFLESR